MRITTRHTIVVGHIMPQYRGVRIAEVTDNGDGTKFVNINGFGCSRNYRTESDEQAIRSMLSEHSATLDQYI